MRQLAGGGSVSAGRGRCSAEAPTSKAGGKGCFDPEGFNEATRDEEQRSRSLK